MGLFGGAGVLAAANGVPLIYVTGKTFGPGGKQVAPLKFSLSLDLEAKPVGDCIEYTAKEDRKVKLTIVHSDGTTQSHTIASPAAGVGPDDTRKVVVCLDPKTGTPGRIYVT